MNFERLAALGAKLQRFAALGALAVCGGVVVVAALIAWLTKPTAVAGSPGATGGANTIQEVVLAVALFVPVALFLWTHLAFAKQLHDGPRSLNE